ncbi:unnamed protein product [Effrenium voratum]|nr:unnamed protein product [Effrenium voratum]
MYCGCLQGLCQWAGQRAAPAPLYIEGLAASSAPDYVVPPNMCCTALGAGAPKGLCRLTVQGDLLLLGSKETGSVLCARLLAAATITVHGHDVRVASEEEPPLRLQVWCSAEAFRCARQLRDASILWTKHEGLKGDLRHSLSKSTMRCSQGSLCCEEYALDSDSLFSPSASDSEEVDEDERWFENENRYDSEEEAWPSHTASAPALRPPLLPVKASHSSSAPSLSQEAPSDQQSEERASSSNGQSDSRSGLERQGRQSSEEVDASQWPKSLKRCEVARRSSEISCFADPELRKKLRKRRAISEGLSVEEATQQELQWQQQAEESEVQRKLSMQRVISDGLLSDGRLGEEEKEAASVSGGAGSGFSTLAPADTEEPSDLENLVEDRMRRTSELLELFSQEQEWLDHAADVMAARRLLAKEEAAAIDALEEEDAHHQEELEQLEEYVRQMSNHCESGGTSSKPDVSQCHALEEKIQRNNSVPSMLRRAEVSKSGLLNFPLRRSRTQTSFGT